MSKQKKQFITRKGNFDSGHRVMNEKMKCFNVHFSNDGGHKIG